jgi:hypothetical protein
MTVRKDCPKQDIRDFGYPHWKANGFSQGMTKRSECKEGHEDDR